MGCIILRESFYITPEPVQGLGPIVSHCSVQFPLPVPVSLSVIKPEVPAPVWVTEKTMNVIVNSHDLSIGRFCFSIVK